MNFGYFVISKLHIWHLKHDLDELITAGILTEDTAQQIRQYYHRQAPDGGSRMLLIFGVLGALLVGLGVVLIVAHNWDTLPQWAKTLLAFTPVLLGQAAGAYALFSKKESVAWKEASATFLVFAIGACISLISQIYHLPGSMAGFLLVWCLLTLPILYIFPSTMTSLLYWIGITAYGVEQGYGFRETDPNYYPLLLGAALPFYYKMTQEKPLANATRFHHWLAPLSATILLGTLANTHGELMTIAYVALFGAWYWVGKTTLIPANQTFNGYVVIGTLGLVSLLTALTFRDFWVNLFFEKITVADLFTTREGWVILTIYLITAMGLYVTGLFRDWRSVLPTLASLAIFFVLLIGLHQIVFAVVLANLLLLGLGISNVWKGIQQDHLGILNIGLLTITALIIARFFDTDLSFVFRGVLFVMVGIGFFAANYLTIQKEKTCLIAVYK
ncbi:MAG: DUF2157 domain-containing protein [Saprospiraceae bacterium]